MLCEELYCCIADLQELFLIRNKRNDRLPFMNTVSEQTAEGNDISMYGVPCFCGTCLYAASAEIAFGFLYGDFSVCMCNGAAAAGLDADATLDAVLFPPFYLNAALDSQVVFLRFQAVVLTSGNAEFEFVRQLLGKIPLVQFLCQSIGIQPLGQIASP